MKTPNIGTLKKYLVSLSKIKAKYVTADRLSRVVGVYPEIINENLSYFEPTLMLDNSFNLLELIPAIKEYINDEEEKRAAKAVKKDLIKKKDLEEFDSIPDFLYKKMTNGLGLIDRQANLSDKDLRTLKRLVNDEIARRKKR